MTSQKQISLFTEEQLTSLQVDSPANLIHPQESDSARRMRDTSGLRCLEQFERFSRAGSWAKTFAGLLIGMEGWYSTKCRLNWKLKATKSHRFYFQLVPSTHPIEETEFGSSLTMLPTPTCFDSTNASNTMKSTQVKEGSMHSVTLTRAMSMGMLPTPMASDATTGAIIGKNDIFVETKGLPRKINQNGTDGSVGLGRLVQMLPTPNQRDYKGCTKPGERTSITGKTQKYGETLPDTIKKISGQTSQLSPQFVMEMMGFPTDWTLLPFLNGDKSQSKQEATQ